MAANKYLSHNAGVLTEIQASVASAGAADDGKIVALDTSGKLDMSLMPTGLGPDAVSIQASENLSAGDFVNIHDSTGARARKADASIGRVAHGFVLSAITSGQSGLVYFEGTNTSVTGMTAGNRVYLSATSAGQATVTAPSTSGHYVQSIGFAIGATAISFEPRDYIVLA